MTNRIAARQLRILARCDFANRVNAQVKAFADQWEREQGYRPAAFQKAIAMQRLERGQTVRQIIDALVAMRV